jgi:hypothetical protein
MALSTEQTWGPADVPGRVIDLAKQGEPDEGGLLLARYNSLQPGVAWVLTTLIREASGKCAALIKYDDETDYAISWDEGEVWSLTHNDTRHAERPEQVLPHTNGLVRAIYVSSRPRTVEGAARGILNMHSLMADLPGRVVGDAEPPSPTDEAMPLVFPDANSLYAAIARERQRLGPFLAAMEAVFLDVDPADVNLAALCLPIMDIDPERDRIPLR